MRPLFHDVGEFHLKFRLPVTRPARRAELLTADLFEYRLRFLQEELDEVVAAHQAGDLVAFADALADLTWVALGTAHFAGLPFELVWDHVKRANMSKVLALADDPRSHKRGAVEVIRKPPDWVAPEAGIRDALEGWNRFADVIR